MLTRESVRVMSQREAEQFQPPAGALCISITTPGTPKPELPGYAGVLRLEFDDLDEKHGAGVHSFGGPLEPFRPRHAAQVLNFVETAPEFPLLVVHCYMGVSRSWGVALGLLDALGSPQPDTRGFNRHVRSTMVETAERMARRRAVPTTPEES